MAEPPTVVVARASIGTELEVHREAEERVEVVAGEIHVKFPYSFHEAGRDRETWRFRLETRLDDIRAPTAIVEWHDRPFLVDEKWGYVRTTHRVPAGTHRLWFKAVAEHGERPWGKGEAAQEEGRVELEGDVEISGV